MREYINNFYSVDGTFKSVQTTRIDYLELGIYPENEIVLKNTIQKMSEMNVQVQKLEKLKNTVLGKIYRKCRNLLKRK